jgi:hypothetical protein
MIHYLNGVSEIGRTKGKAKAKFKKTFKKFTKTVKALDEKKKALNRKIVADAKKRAIALGKNIKRIALIPRAFAFKKLLFALEKDLFQMSTRIKILFKQDAADTKNFLSTIGDYSKIVAAVNKGAKTGANIGAIKNTRQRIKDCYGANGSPIFTSGGVYQGCGGCQGCVGEDAGDGKMTAAQYEEYSKEAVGLIQKIIAWFKKRKADKAGDQESIDDMNNAVETDGDIPVADGDGNPVTDAKPQSSTMIPYLIGGAVLVGGYFLMKKK